MKIISKLSLCAFVVVLAFSNCTKRVEEPAFALATYEQVAGPFWRVNDIQFVDAQTGIMLVDYETLYKTTDGGVTWNSIYTVQQSTLKSFVFPQKDTIYAFIQLSSGDDHDIDRSTDGGGVWAAVAPLADVIVPAFCSGKTGYAMSAIPPSNQLRLVRTNNAGVTWSNVGTYTDNTAVLGFTSYSMGYTLNGARDFLRSTDAGITWTVTQSDIGSMTRMSANGVCYAVQDGVGIIKTADYGQTWSTVLPNASNGVEYNHIAFYNETVYVAYNNNFLVSKDGGATWKDYVYRDKPDLWQYRVFDIYAVDESHALVYGETEYTGDNVVLRATFP